MRSLGSVEPLSDPEADQPHANASAHLRQLPPNGLEDLPSALRRPINPDANASAHLRRLPPDGLEDAPMGRGRRAPRMSLGRARAAPRGEARARLRPV
jgi:hypothetical protein